MARTLLLATLMLVGPTLAQTPDAPPSTPDGLRANAYGRTGGEVLWNRSRYDRGAVRGYEITRDGTVLGVRDTLSVVERGLLPATTYRYGITAIDGAGQRSGTATVELTTRGDGGSAGGPAAPSGLRADVYSPTAAELFWTRPATTGLRYEVRRDGRSLGSTDGTGYFDDALGRGRSYVYEIVAIDPQGRRSTAASIALTTQGDAPVEPPPATDPFATPDPDGTTVIARLGYPAAREIADELVSTGYLHLYYEIEGALIDLLSSGEEFGEDVSRTCPGGGSVRGAMRFFFEQDVTFDDCTIEGRTLSGRYTRVADFTVTGGGGSQRALLTFDALNIDAGTEGRLLVSGTSARRDFRSDDLQCFGASPVRGRSVENRIESARIERDGGVSNVTGASWMQRVESYLRRTNLSDGPDSEPDCAAGRREVSFAGEASVASTPARIAGASLAKSGELVHDPRENAESTSDARLTADFGDGSTLAVTATSDAGAQVDVVADGASVSFDDDYRFEARDDIPTIIGY